MDDEIKAQLIDLGIVILGALTTAVVGLIGQLARKANAWLDQQLHAGEFANVERLASNAFEDLQRQAGPGPRANDRMAQALAARRMWGSAPSRKRSIFRPRNREEKLKVMVEEAVEQVVRQHLERSDAQADVVPLKSQEGEDVQSER